MRNLIRKAGSAPWLYMLFLKIRSFRGKSYLMVLCVAGLICYNIFAFMIFERYKRDSRETTCSFIDLIEAEISVGVDSSRIEPIVKQVIKGSVIPVVLTDSLWNPVIWNNIYTGFLNKKRLQPQYGLNQVQAKFLKKKIEELKVSYRPLPVFARWGGTARGYLVFGDNALVSSLVLLPFMEAGLIALLFVLVYIALHNIRVTERSNLWVGLAKETAHQLGTPISSLMGWVEYMRTVREADPPIEPEAFLLQVHKICDDMDNDLKRLRKVTARFSQIGSVPALVSGDINEIISESADYFQMRLPLLGKRIEMKFDSGNIPRVSVNRDLLGWVFENLMKNSVDAISRQDGRIEISTKYNKNDHMVKILHRDNGKGISWEAQKKIFAPGYSTKKRGWGLGLTLAKRIIEDYHNGKIYVSWSVRGKGTVICVELPERTGHEQPKT